jgi:hypothetical protein
VDWAGLYCMLGEHLQWWPMICQSRRGTESERALEVGGRVGARELPSHGKAAAWECQRGGAGSGGLGGIKPKTSWSEADGERGHWSKMSSEKIGIANNLF